MNTAPGSNIAALYDVAKSQRMPSLVGDCVANKRNWLAG